MKKKYKVCTKCIMDTTDPGITFDENGICSHCKRYQERAEKELKNKTELQEIIKQIKKEGRGKKYDCIIGLSGGADSTATAFYVKKFGLRPLAIHADNGWDTETSKENIKNIVRKLNIDLYMVKANWEEFKDLQLAFLKASIPNAEIPTDHIIVAILYEMAVKNGVRYIISGGNIATEGIMPESWGYDPKDLRYLKAIHNRFGRIKLKTFPQLGLLKWLYYAFVKRIKFIPILNYLNYNKKETQELIKRKLDWKEYGEKHYESVYTRFFQSYILPRKFGIDKRRAHYSTLINSGQMTREEALEKMKEISYIEGDKEYVLEKLELSEKEFEEIMALPKKSYKDYPNYYWLIGTEGKLRPAIRWIYHVFMRRV
jgi:N-acetyl sugar amidotransferase